MLNALRYRLWEQRQELKKMIESEKKNLAVISDLADKAEASARAKSEYLNTLSHEVRTPLTVISTYTQLAVRQFRQGKMDEQIIEGLDAVYEEAMRIAELAANTLSPRENEEKIADLAEIARQLIRLHTPMAQAAGRTINVNLANPLLTVCNVGEITQVIWNLLDNAIKHGERGDINVDGNVSDEYAYIIITDYGAGIPPDMLPRVFERGVSGKDGSGLGLAISNEIIQKHGGKLMIESEHGLGTTATVLLPTYHRKERAPHEE
jgi:signal transduction histidine kinase